MKYSLKRLWATLLAALMLVGAMPLDALADSSVLNLAKLVAAKVVERSASISGIIGMTMDPDGNLAPDGSTFSISLKSLVDEKTSLSSPNLTLTGTLSNVFVPNNLYVASGDAGEGGGYAQGNYAKVTSLMVVADQATQDFNLYPY